MSMTEAGGRMGGPVPGERILVVDDEPGVRSALEAILADEGFRVRCVASGEEGLEVVETETFDAVLLDVWLPGSDGLATLQELRARRVEAPVVMISGHANIDTAVRATKLGAFDFVEKPLSLEKTLLVLRNAMRQSRLERTNLHLLEQLSRDTEIVGRSAAAQHLRRDVEVASGSDAPVLIVGATGSGRETVARRIHASGGRADAPFVEVPCAALDAAAAVAALYGAAAEGGRMLLAAGGTLFLEDANRLAAELQPRLAASLQRQARTPPGLRVMASVASASDGLDPALRQCVDVIRITVPDLRQRREDIPLLVERFMREISREYGRPAKPLAPDTLAALQGHDWPGNIRELRNLVERLLLFAPGDIVVLQDLPETLGGATGLAEDLYREFDSLKEGVLAFERYYVLRVLTEVGADREKAASRLGLSPKRLNELLKRL